MLKIMLNTNKIHPVSKPNIFSAIFFTFQCFVDINFNQKWLISESLLSLKASRIVELLCVKQNLSSDFLHNVQKSAALGSIAGPCRWTKTQASHLFLDPDFCRWPDFLGGPH